jgi:hypothetical protein
MLAWRKTARSSSLSARRVSLRHASMALTTKIKIEGSADPFCTLLHFPLSCHLARIPISA